MLFSFLSVVLFSSTVLILFVLLMFVTLFFILLLFMLVFFSFSLNCGVSTVKGGLVYKITIFSVFSFLTLLSAAPSLRRRLLAFLQLGQ